MTPGIAAILDVDGTLVDTNYHHALAWYRALRTHGVIRPLWRIHRHIGMGGDHLVAAVAGERIERERGDDIRASETELYAALIDEVEPMDGARRLIEELKARGHRVVLASSAKEQEVEHYLEMLKAHEVCDGWTSSDDVQATKPKPDLVMTAMMKAGAQRAVMIGDSTFDCESAGRAGVPTIGVLTGGFSEMELRDAGAIGVYDSLGELTGDLDHTPLSGS